MLTDDHDDIPHMASLDSFGKEPPPELAFGFEKKLFRAFNARGARVPITGPWIVGTLHTAGPKYGWELYKAYNEFADLLGARTINYQTIVKKLYYLQFIGVTQKLPSEEAVERGLPIEPDDPIPEKGEAEKRVYNELHEVDTSFLDAEDYVSLDIERSVAASEAGQQVSRVQTVFPPRVANPYKIWRLYRYLQDQGDVSEVELREHVVTREAELANPTIEWPANLSFDDLAGENLIKAKQRVL